MRKALLLSLVLTACGPDKADNPERDGNLDPTDLRAAHALWLTELAAVSDPATGWPSATDCDGTLWAGLAAAGGAPVDVSLAEYAPGVVHRRPSSVGACWTPEAGDVGSRSTVSQDMLTGYLWGAWAKQDLAAVQRLADYGEAHEIRVARALVGWVMGQPYPAEASRVVARGNLFGLVGRMLEKLSNRDDARSYRKTATTYATVGADYARHIQTLGILLQGEVRGKVLTAINSDELDRVKANADEAPNDALFQAALSVYTGDSKPAETLLLNPGYECPAYVRGAAAYCLVHKVFAASILLKRNPAL